MTGIAFRGLAILACAPLFTTASAAGERDRAAVLEHLFARPELLRLELNPTGNLVAAHRIEFGRHLFTVENGDSGEVSRIARRSRESASFGWIDDDTLVVRSSDHESSRTTIFDLVPREYSISSTERTIRAWGWLIDSLPLVEDHVLWATWNGEESHAYRVPVSELEAPSGPKLGARRFPNPRYRVASLSYRVLYWLSDQEGEPRAALALREDDPVEFTLLHRRSAGSTWREIGSWGQEDEAPVPAGITADGRDLVVLSSEERDTVALRRYLVEEERLGEVIHANPSSDISGVVWAHQGYEVIAVSYDEGGLRRYEHFDEFDTATQAWLDGSFPDMAVHLTSRTASKRLMTVLVTSGSEPGRFFLVDTSKRTMRMLGKVMPAVYPAMLSPVQVLTVGTRDGRSIEAFFTRPRSVARPPLVVMPHGGPLGVSDRREFDPVVQALAGNGYAVLQMNYRGSGGKGTSFLEAGKGAWGSGIEDDIEDALGHVLAVEDVDPERLCILGGSYGGYSALISITRRPSRYRCAVAVAAPTDLFLLVSQGSDAARRFFVETIGDPVVDRQHLIDISPVYRAAAMDVPLLLVHGDSDRRVDLEHFARMRTMLEYHRKPTESVLIEDATHFPTSGQWIALMERVLTFLDLHLATDRPKGTDEMGP